MSAGVMPFVRLSVDVSRETPSVRADSTRRTHISRALEDAIRLEYYNTFNRFCP